MNNRLQALVDRGYSKEEVLWLSSYSEDDIGYCVERAFQHISRNCTRVKNPNSFFIGGQPGCGKSVLSMKIKSNFQNILEIGIDNYRTYHPNYLEIEKCIRRHWNGRTITENDSPGNDIADFTHWFAGDMMDRLIKKGYEKDSEGKSFNMVLEWGMRTPEKPLETMEILANNNYFNNVIFVATNKITSMDACNVRANVMKNSNRIIRKVPKSFHDLSINTLPQSLNEIYNVGQAKGIINSFIITNRNGELIWSTNDQRNPMEVYSNYINSPKIFNEDYNSENLSKKTTKNELIGIYDQLEKLKKEQYYFTVINPQLTSYSRR